MIKSVLINPYTFVLLLNLHSLNHYVPSRAYGKEPPFNHFDSTFSRIPAQPSESLFFAGMTTEQGESHSTHQRAPLPNTPTTATSLPYPPPNYNPPRQSPRHSASPCSTGGRLHWPRLHWTRLRCRHLLRSRGPCPYLPPYTLTRYLWTDPYPSFLFFI